MKTNSFARRIWKARVLIFCVAAVIAGTAQLYLGELLTNQQAKAAAVRTGTAAVPKVCLHELMASAR